MNKYFDHFSVRLIEEDSGEWTAYLIGLPNVSAGGNTPEEALRKLKKTWEAMKEDYLKQGKEIPQPNKETMK